mgnify:CR=1 FL=1
MGQTIALNVRLKKDNARLERLLGSEIHIYKSRLPIEHGRAASCRNLDTDGDSNRQIKENSTFYGDEYFGNQKKRQDSNHNSEREKTKSKYIRCMIKKPKIKYAGCASTGRQTTNGN